MLVIGRALMADPRLVLLDEPSLGLAPMVVQEIYEIIKKINQDRQVSMLIVEQNVRAALGISNYGYVMENGRVVLNGPADKLSENEDVREFYMGLSATGAQKSYRDVSTTVAAKMVVMIEGSILDCRISMWTVVKKDCNDRIRTT
jgi:branched-chain amino acid transport system ATP-binding protein